MKINTLYHQDCLEGIKQLRDNSVDLIVTDPPYEFENKNKGIYSIARFKKQMEEISKIGTNSFDFDKYIPPLLDLQKDKVNAYFFCNKKLLPNYLNEAIKRKLNYDVLIFGKLNPVPAFNNSHMNELEYIVFLRSSGVYFSSKEGYTTYKKYYAENIGHHGLMHPNQKPLELIRRFIRISSKKGDTILDPFVGSGTTLLACKQLNRNFIGFEISKKFVKISNERLSQSNLGGFL